MIPYPYLQVIYYIHLLPKVYRFDLLNSVMLSYGRKVPLAWPKDGNYFKLTFFIKSIVCKEY